MPFGRDLAPSMLHRHSGHGWRRPPHQLVCGPARDRVITAEVEPGSHY
ncbi:hypothetical protein I546_6688 [Mycobacterium kansasii 732]|nr:hypothetical protein I546_6688 [Mycobacterium kansasii 732]